MRPVQQVTTELTAEDKAQEKALRPAAETGAEHSSDITDDNRTHPLRRAQCRCHGCCSHTGTAETASPSEPAETQPVRQATLLNRRLKINRRKSVLVSATETSTANEAAALKRHRFSAACAVFDRWKITYLRTFRYSGEKAHGG